MVTREQGKTYKSRLNKLRELVGRAFLTLLRLSLKLMGMRDVPGIFAIVGDPETKCSVKLPWRKKGSGRWMLENGGEKGPLTAENRPFLFTFSPRSPGSVTPASATAGGATAQLELSHAYKMPTQKYGKTARPWSNCFLAPPFSGCDASELPFVSYLGTQSILPNVGAMARRIDQYLGI